MDEERPVRYFYFDTPRRNAEHRSSAKARPVKTGLVAGFFLRGPPRLNASPRTICSYPHPLPPLVCIVQPASKSRSNKPHALSFGIVLARLACPARSSIPRDCTLCRTNRRLRVIVRVRRPEYLCRNKNQSSTAGGRRDRQECETRFGDVSLRRPMLS